MSQAIARAERQKTMFAVLFLDLDRFKLINDSLSHEAGDEILRKTAQRLSLIIRKEDTLARLGGDEFIIIANEIRERKDILRFANKILDCFAEVFVVMEREVYITPSFGISFYPEDSTEVDILLSNADKAMYQAKALGGNQYQFYTGELNKMTIYRSKKESDIRFALKNGEFFLYYQPQYDLNTGTLLSLEALIRWNHPSEGVLLPIDFIPLAEESGLFAPIGEWVMRTACKQAKEWQKEGLPPIRVAINISAKQFKLYNFIDTVKKILEEVDLEPQYLELELSESAFINNMDSLSTIQDLKKLGVQIALDDFGTGYSCLNYLRDTRIDRLKIDRSYIQNIDTDRGDDVIIQAIITMANALHLDVVAEGVETEKQLDFLKKEHCSQGQGYYFSKPISAGDCVNLLKHLRPDADNLKPHTDN